MKILFSFLFILTFTSCLAKEIPITLEYAKTEKERNFGLMQRAFLPKDQGMLLVYPEKSKIRIWMLNCLIDLSVAFLDEKGVILEIHELKAYPKKIGFPLKNYEELLVYNERQVFQFFLEQSVISSNLALYALEMNKGWFKENEVLPGDILKTDFINPKALIIYKIR